MPLPCNAFLPFLLPSSPASFSQSLRVSESQPPFPFSGKMLDFQFPVLDETEIQELLSLFETETETEDQRVTSQSGSEDTNTAVCNCSGDERKLRRMKSNRESARRSRWRKKKHLENLSNEVNRLVAQNREYKNRLCSVTHQSHIVGRDNERLTYEYLALRAKLYDLYRISAAMQLQ